MFIDMKAYLSLEKKKQTPKKLPNEVDTCKSRKFENFSAYPGEICKVCL